MGVATAHDLNSPLLLRSAGRRSARPSWRLGRARTRWPRRGSARV